LPYGTTHATYLRAAAENAEPHAGQDVRIYLQQGDKAPEGPPGEALLGEELRASTPIIDQ
jgi:hypothetical protein